MTTQTREIIQRDMKKYIIAMTLALMALTACEQQWDNVPVKALTTDETIGEEYQYMTVNELKSTYFYSIMPEPAGNVKSVTIPDKVYLKTKVISSDELGNTYKSIYLQDAQGPENGAIEIKVGKGSMYTIYKPGQIIYVKCDGLELGNYRWMLSLGGKSSEDKYSNGYIDIQTTIDEKILPGEMVGLTTADTLVINSSNVASIISNDKQYLGTLCRFEGLESVWGTINANGYSSDDTFPSFLEQIVDVYTDYTWTGQPDEQGRYTLSPAHKDHPEGLPATWAYSYFNAEGKSNSYYGSALFAFGSSYPFIVRTSGYSRFALEPIPADGEVVDMTAILCKYCENSTTPKYNKYQLLLNSSTDVEVK